MSDKKTADKFHIANLDQLTDPALAKRFDVIGDGKAKPAARRRAGVSLPKWQPSENLPLKIAKISKTHCHQSESAGLAVRLNIDEILYSASSAGA